MSRIVVLTRHRKTHQPIHRFRRRRAPERHLRLGLPPRALVAVQLLDDEAWVPIDAASASAQPARKNTIGPSTSTDESEFPGVAAMLGIRGRKSLFIVVGLLGTFFIFTVFVVPRINPPQPTTHSFLISNGGVSRAIIGSKDPKAGRPGTFVPPYQPHHIDFTSSNGPIDVYVVPFSIGNPEADVDHQAQLTEQLQAGQPPGEFLAKGSGKQGRIDLAGWWPFGWAKSLVLIHSQNESDVRVVVHYGPNE